MNRTQQENLEMMVDDIVKIGVKQVSKEQLLILGFNERGKTIMTRQYGEFHAGYMRKLHNDSYSFVGILYNQSFRGEA